MLSQKLELILTILDSHLDDIEAMISLHKNPDQIIFEIEELKNKIYDLANDK